MRRSAATALCPLMKAAGFQQPVARGFSAGSPELNPARRTAGAGLGLPIARWIAEVHGGTLALEESGQGGSTFDVVLPLTG